MTKPSLISIRKDQAAPKLVPRAKYADDVALFEAFKDGDPCAPAALIKRHGDHIKGVLANVIGIDAELPDLMQEVFIKAFKGLHTLRDANRLRAWLTSIAVFTAKRFIRRRKRKYWLCFFAPETLPEPEAPEVPEEVWDATNATYRVLNNLSTDLRIAFALRYISEMELVSIAAACGVSRSTIKRRLAKAEKRFLVLARKEQALVPWLQGRWEE